MADTGSEARPSTPSMPSVRSWRAAFLTLRDETLTAPAGTSIGQMLENLIFSHSQVLMSAVPELPSHEVLSDILFMMELVANTADEENMTHIFTRTSHLINDISRCVSLEMNLSSFTRVLNCFGKMLDHFLGKAAANDKLAGIQSIARIRPAIECLQAIRCIINLSHQRWSQSEDTQLVKFLLDIILSSHAVLCLASHSTCKERSSTKVTMRLSKDGSSWELQTVAFTMVGEAISRSGSSFPVDIWRLMIEVVRKTTDDLALKSPIVEDDVMSRFYESFLHCLHLILIDPKCPVADHVSVFVAVLRMFITYGLSSRISHTSLPIGREEKERTIMSPKASWDHVNKAENSAYRPPHLRKDCSSVKQNRTWHSQYVSESDTSVANVTSSDSDISDGDGSAKESDSMQNSRVREAAIICIQDLCQADSKFFSMQWSLLLPTSDVLQLRKCDATLMTCLLFDPYLKARIASASTLAAMLDGPSSIFLQVAEYKESSKCGAFTALSSSLGQILLQLHRGILYLIQHEAHGRLLALLFKILRLVISSTPYSRMPPDLLPIVVKSLKRRIEEGFWFKSDQTGLLAAAFGCLTLALSTSPSSAHVRKMLLEEVSAGYIEAEKKSGVLFTLFEYSTKWSYPSICLEALQALKAVSHSYPNVIVACWEQVSAIVYRFVGVVYPEVPSSQASEHVGSPTMFIGEKILTAAIKVLDECLRAVSGFQGTEDLSDDKLLVIPFASDFIRMKKVSSAPSYESESESKDNFVINSKTCESGIRQWCEAIEKHLPLILRHSSAMVRAASVTCFAGMTSAVFISFTKEKQDFIMSSLINAAVHDNVPSVRSAACRAIGIISCFPQVCQSVEILDRFIHAVEVNTHDSLVSVRITASWALANICEAIRYCVSDLPFDNKGSSANPQLIVLLSECAMRLTKDVDKVKSNAVRALGYISRIFKCTNSSRFQDISVDYLTEALSEDPKLCHKYESYSCQLDYLKDSQRLERMVQAFISCVTTGNVKVQWNVCHAFGNLFLNETLRLQDMDWAPFVFGILLQLLRDSSNFKIRIQAAAALAVPVSVHDYGLSFPDIVQGVEHVIENFGVDPISAPSSFKYRIALQKQVGIESSNYDIGLLAHSLCDGLYEFLFFLLTLTMLHVLSFTSSTNHDPLKDFLVKKALFLEDWFKGLCLPVEETNQLDVQNKSSEDQKKVMISRAIQSLITVYKEKQQHAIAQKFEELRIIRRRS